MKKLSKIIGIAALLMATLLIGCAPVTDSGDGAAGADQQHVTPARPSDVNQGVNSDLRLSKSLLEGALSGEWSYTSIAGVTNKLTLYPVSGGVGKGVYTTDGSPSIRADLDTPVTLSDLENGEKFTWTIEAETQLRLVMDKKDANENTRYVNLIFDYDSDTGKPEIYPSGSNKNPKFEQLLYTKGSAVGDDVFDPAYKTLAVDMTSGSSTYREFLNQTMLTTLVFKAVDASGTTPAKPAITVDPMDENYTDAEMADISSRGLTAAAVGRDGRTKIPVRYNAKKPNMKIVDVWLLNLADSSIEKYPNVTYETEYTEISGSQVPTAINLLVPDGAGDAITKYPLSYYDKNNKEYGLVADRDTADPKPIIVGADVTALKAWDGWSKDLAVFLNKKADDQKVLDPASSSQAKVATTELDTSLTKFDDERALAGKILLGLRYDYGQIVKKEMPADTGTAPAVYVKEFNSTSNIDDIEALVKNAKKGNEEVSPVQDTTKKLGGLIVSSAEFYESAGRFKVKVEVLEIKVKDDKKLDSVAKNIYRGTYSATNNVANVSLPDLYYEDSAAKKPLIETITLPTNTTPVPVKDASGAVIKTNVLPTSQEGGTGKEPIGNDALAASEANEGKYGVVSAYYGFADSKFDKAVITPDSFTIDEMDIYANQLSDGGESGDDKKLAEMKKDFIKKVNAALVLRDVDGKKISSTEFKTDKPAVTDADVEKWPALADFKTGARINIKLNVAKADLADEAHYVLPDSGDATTATVTKVFQVILK